MILLHDLDCVATVYPQFPQELGAGALALPPCLCRKEFLIEIREGIAYCTLNRPDANKRTLHFCKASVALAWNFGMCCMEA